MFIATYIFFPNEWAYSIVLNKSSSSIAALDLKDKLDVPQYIASAP